MSVAIDDRPSARRPVANVELFDRVHLCAQGLELFVCFLFGEISLAVHIEHLSDFDFAVAGLSRLWNTFDPFYGFFYGLDLPQPEPRDQFFGLSEGAVGHGDLIA